MRDVVLKVLKGEGQNKRLFLKEARLLNKIIGHENIATFIVFCTAPTYSLMMEYVYFDFCPFGVKKGVISLGDLHTCPIPSNLLYSYKWSGFVT